MQASAIELAPFTPDHLDGAVMLSRQAGWPHRRQDWAMVLSLSTGIVARQGQRVVGTTLVTRYGEQAATINMVIVDEAMRGRGIGRRLMNFALEESKGRECRLVATKEGLPLYTKLGFRASGAIVQHQGIAALAHRPDEVEWAAPEDVAEFAAMDRTASGLDRAALIPLLFEQGRVAVLRRNGRTAGFAALRLFGRGQVAGPVVAATADEARSLLSFLLAACPGEFLRVDTSEASGLSPWLAERGLAHVGGGIAMQRGRPARVDVSPFQTFALANQALG
jgi:predicted N-acetyltransferase YhbS